MKKNYIVLIITCLLFLNAPLIHGYISLNDLECLFKNEPEKKILRDQMIAGSAKYLAAKSHLYAFASEVELTANVGTRLNREAATPSLGKSLEWLDASLQSYQKAYQVAQSLPINKEQLKKLTNAQYESKDYGLKVIHSAAVKYLKRGDVLGIYARNIRNLKKLHSMLLAVQEELMTTGGVSPKNVRRIIIFDASVTAFGALATDNGNPVLTGGEEHCGK